MPRTPRIEDYGPDDKVKMASPMSDALFEAVAAAKPADAPHLHPWFNFVCIKFAKSWRRGGIARVYIGTAHDDEDSIQRTLYVQNKTYRALHHIADCDGVSAGTVIRTACAWFLHRYEKRDDPWGSDVILPPRVWPPDLIL